MSLTHTVSQPKTFFEGTYVTFNNTDKYLLNSTAQTIGIVNAWSIAFTQRTPTDTGEIDVFFELGNNGPASNSSISIDNQWNAAGNNFRVRVRDNGGTQRKDLDYDGFFTVGVGYHVVVTFDGGVTGDPLLIYKNGVFVSPSASTDTACTMSDDLREVSMGANTATVPTLFSGASMGDVMVWSNALTPAEIKYIYSNRKTLNPRNNEGGYVSGTTLQHWWRPGFLASDIGRDYGRAATPIDVDTNSANITIADIKKGFLV